MPADLDYVSSLGQPLIAHRLRRLSELLVDGYGKWLPSRGITAPARTISTIMLLQAEGPLGVTELAARLRLSHPLMIKFTAALAAQGLTTIMSDPSDARRRPIALTAAGRAEAGRIAGALAAMDRAYAALFAEAGIDLLRAVETVEAALGATPFDQRLRTSAPTIPAEEDLTCA